jgi:hypothetical protein
LADLWRLLVKDVGGKSVDPVPFVVDWDMFRSDLGESLGGTALERYFDWNGRARVRDKQLEAKYRKKQGDIV